MMIEIALEHARRGATFLRDEWGIPAFRVGSDTELLGVLIPLSLYHSTPKIESMNIYELCDGRIWTDEERETLSRIDHVQACYPPKKWAKKLERLLREFG